MPVILLFHTRTVLPALVQITNSQSKIVYKDLPVDDPKVRQPDISKAKSILRWEPKVPRLDGLRKTMEYFKRKVG